MNKSENSMTLNNNNAINIESYKIGDCFEFKDSIKDFGLVLISEDLYPDGQEYKLFPVKLDNSKTGLEKFRFGEVFISKFIDQTNSKGFTEGFNVYYFLHEKNFETLNKLFNYKGNLSLKKDYINATGGTMASDLSTFKFQLNIWDKMFGENAHLVTVNNVIQ